MHWCLQKLSSSMGPFTWHGTKAWAPHCLRILKIQWQEPEIGLCISSIGFFLSDCIISDWKGRRNFEVRCLEALLTTMGPSWNQGLRCVGHYMMESQQKTSICIKHYFTLLNKNSNMGLLQFFSQTPVTISIVGNLLVFNRWTRMFLVGTLVPLLFPSVDLPCRDGHELILKTLCANVVSQKRMDAIHSGFPVGVHYQSNIYIEGLGLSMLQSWPYCVHMVSQS